MTGRRPKIPHPQSGTSLPHRSSEAALDVYKSANFFIFIAISGLFEEPCAAPYPWHKPCFYLTEKKVQKEETLKPPCGGMPSGVTGMTILRSVWQKLSAKHSAAKSATAKPELPKPATLKLASVSAVAKESKNTIPGKDTIPDQYLPLWQLLNQRQLIEVKVEGSSFTYQTLVLAIDVQRGLLWLDDLFP
jgi:hypothetical protein